jgi:hypothetical protein
VDAPNAGTLCAGDSKALLTEMIRVMLAGFWNLQRNAQFQDDSDVDARIAALETENRSTRRPVQLASQCPWGSTAISGAKFSR